MQLLKVGTSHAHFKDVFGDVESLIKIRECGFDSVDFGFHAYQDDKDFILTQNENQIKTYFSGLKKVADDIGLEIGQTHAPYYFCPMEKFIEKDFVKIYANAIKAASYIGSKYLVVHPALTDDPENNYMRNFKINLNFYSQLKPYIQDYGITVAIENMDSINPLKTTGMPGVCSSAEKINHLLDELGDGYCACLDTGHAFLAGQNPAHMARLLGSRLKVLHMQDGDGNNDMHIAPTCGYINWNEFLEALHAIDYQGILNFEIDFLRSGAKNIMSLGKFLVSLGNDFSSRIAKME